MDMRPLIKLSRLSGGYEGKIVLHDVNLEIYPNDFVGIIGPNGGGKTTLVKLILGLLKPMSGEIEFNLNGKKADWLSIGYLPQYSAVDKKFPISVYDVILSGLGRQKSLWRPFTESQHEQVRHIIARMGLEGLERRAIGSLSGGQVQRTLLGRALVSNPQILILDEPDTYIDKHFESQLYSLLDEINRECAIVLVSHDIGTLLQHAEKLAFISGTLHCCRSTDVSAGWLEEHLTGVW